MYYKVNPTIFSEAHEYFSYVCVCVWGKTFIEHGVPKYLIGEWTKEIGSLLIGTNPRFGTHHSTLTRPYD